MSKGTKTVLSKKTTEKVAKKVATPVAKPVAEKKPAKVAKAPKTEKVEKVTKAAKKVTAPVAKPVVEKKPAKVAKAAKKAIVKIAEPVVKADKVEVLFEADCPLATTVAVAGTFNGWSISKNMLEKDNETGLWFVKIDLPAGDYEYKFVCDGLFWDSGDNKIKHV